MKILRSMVILALGLYVGGIVGMCMYPGRLFFLLMAVAGISGLAAGCFTIIEKNYKAEIKRIDKEFDEKMRKINRD